MNAAFIREVWQRAAGRCEYCRLPAHSFPLTFHVDHITPRQHGGATALDNLALACLHCNRHKGPNLAGLDPMDGELIRLYHPRQDLWADHFEWRAFQVRRAMSPHDGWQSGGTRFGIIFLNVPEACYPSPICYVPRAAP